jgi:hypothetical protein
VASITSLGIISRPERLLAQRIGDVTNTNPSLAPLANNGGATQTMALPYGSPATNHIPYGTNGCATTITTDQRGFARVAPCDIGAFEYVLRLYLPLILK